MGKLSIRKRQCHDASLMVHGTDCIGTDALSKTIRVALLDSMGCNGGKRAVILSVPSDNV